MWNEMNGRRARLAKEAVVWRGVPADIVPADVLGVALFTGIDLWSGSGWRDGDGCAE